MTATRSLAAIAADLRRYDADLLVVRERLADELDALDAVLVPRPDPDTIADLRAWADRLRQGRWPEAADHLAAFLDTLDPPPVVADVDEPDRRALVNFLRDTVKAADSREVFVAVDILYHAAEVLDALAARAALAAHPAPTPDTDEGSGR